MGLTKQFIHVVGGLAVELANTLATPSPSRPPPSQGQSQPSQFQAYPSSPQPTVPNPEFPGTETSVYQSPNYQPGPAGSGYQQHGQSQTVPLTYQGDTQSSQPYVNNSFSGTPNSGSLAPTYQFPAYQSHPQGAGYYQQSQVHAVHLSSPPTSPPQGQSSPSIQQYLNTSSAVLGDGITAVTHQPSSTTAGYRHSQNNLSVPSPSSPTPPQVYTSAAANSRVPISQTQTQGYQPPVTHQSSSASPGYQQPQNNLSVTSPASPTPSPKHSATTNSKVPTSQPQTQAYKPYRPNFAGNQAAPSSSQPQKHSPTAANSSVSNNVSHPPAYQPYQPGVSANQHSTQNLFAPLQAPPSQQQCHFSQSCSSNTTPTTSNTGTQTHSSQPQPISSGHQQTWPQPIAAPHLPQMNSQSASTHPAASTQTQQSQIQSMPSSPWYTAFRPKDDYHPYIKDRVIRDDGDGKLQDCVGKNPVAPARFAYHPAAPEFLICPQCLATLADTDPLLVLSLQFTQEMKLKPCNFSISSPRLTLSLLPKARQTQDSQPVIDFLVRRSTIPECEGKTETAKFWYIINHPGMPSDFGVCSACYEDIILALPAVAEHFHPRFLPHRFFCDLSDPFNQRATLIFSKKPQPEGLSQFCQAIQSWRTALSHPCPALDPRTKYTGNWYIAPQVPGLTICENCYYKYVSLTVFHDKFVRDDAQDNNQHQMCYFADQYWCMTVPFQFARGRRSWELFERSARIIITSPPCSAEKFTGNTMHTVVENPTNDPFQICPACFAGFIQPRGFSSHFKQINVRPYEKGCSLHPRATHYRWYFLFLSMAYHYGCWAFFKNSLAESKPVGPAAPDQNSIHALLNLGNLLSMMSNNLGVGMDSDLQRQIREMEMRSLRRTQETNAAASTISHAFVMQGYRSALDLI